MKRRAAELETEVPAPMAAEPPAPVADRESSRGAPVADAAEYGRDLEDRYVAARDAWAEAMHTANSGRPADMAALAIAQEAYESVAAEREDWLASGRVAIPIQPDPERHDIEIAVRQELAWRRVLQRETRRGILSRIRRRIIGR